MSGISLQSDVSILTKTVSTSKKRNSAVEILTIDAFVCCSGIHDDVYYDPVVAVYPVHSGPISCVTVSPLAGNIFATTGEDKVSTNSY